MEDTVKVMMVPHYQTDPVRIASCGAPSSGSSFKERPKMDFNDRECHKGILETCVIGILHIVFPPYVWVVWSDLDHTSRLRSHCLPQPGSDSVLTPRSCDLSSSDSCGFLQRSFPFQHRNKKKKDILEDIFALLVQAGL